MTSGDIEISGGSTVDLKEKVTEVRLVMSGGGKGRLEDLFTQDGEVVLSGSGIVTINASGRLDVNASGSPRLTYLGNPTLGSINLSDAASIIRQ